MAHGGHADQHHPAGGHGGAGAAAGGFNESDPHGQGAHGQHASHHIVPPFVLRTVLAILLLFTALTVGMAQLEVAVADWLNMPLPWWVNVTVAMSIATVKAVLVMAYFMQLRYENLMNTLVMAFCLFACALFLLFTSLDLFTRHRVYAWEEGQVVVGGTGTGVKGAGGNPIVVAARERHLAKLMEEHGAERAKQIFEQQRAESRAKNPFFQNRKNTQVVITGSTGDASRRREGRTDALDMSPAPANGTRPGDGPAGPGGS